MKLAEKLPKGFVSFLGGFFVCFGAMQSVLTLSFPFLIFIYFTGSEIDRVQRTAIVMPYIWLVGLILSLLVAYIALQLHQDRLFRKGVIWAASINLIIGISSIFG